MEGGSGGAVVVPRRHGLHEEETRRPRQDSNLRFRLRRAALYPLSYGGLHEQEACIRIDDNCFDTAYPARRTTVAA